jgi:adenine deaminase
MVMLCSDDKHPDDLVKGHMNIIAARAVAKGKDHMKVLRCLTLNPIKHYSLDVGLLQKGDAADFIIVEDLKNFNVLATYINGVLVAENGKTHIKSIKEKQPNIFKTEFLAANDLQIKPEGNLIKVIEAIDGQLITNCILEKPKVENNNVVSDTDRDILKMVVMNRYIKAKPAIGFIKNFGFIKGAIASTVAHDSHNIIAIGTSDEEIVKAINLLIESKGGISLINEIESFSLPLPVAGLMSTEDAFYIASQYEAINNKVKEIGTKLHSPYMTLSFMALLVIPDLKLSDLGLFDGKEFSFTELFVKKS